VAFHDGSIGRARSRERKSREERRGEEENSSRPARRSWVLGVESFADDLRSKTVTRGLNEVSESGDEWKRWDGGW